MFRAKPLLQNNKITNNYTREIINIVENLGNYMFFVPKIAFVHATSENVIENSMALLTLKSEINVNTTDSDKNNPLTIDIDKIPVTKILLLHYPPFNESNTPSGFTDLMETYNVDTCIFGHLHDQISFKRIPKEFGSTKLELVSADYLDFKLKEIM